MFNAAEPPTSHHIATKQQFYFLTLSVKPETLAPQCTAQPKSKKSAHCYLIGRTMMSVKNSKPRRSVVQLFGWELFCLAVSKTTPTQIIKLHLYCIYTFSQGYSFDFFLIFAHFSGFSGLGFWGWNLILGFWGQGFQLMGFGACGMGPSGFSWG